MKKKITVIMTSLGIEGVDFRFYTEDKQPIIGKDGLGRDYHLGQISSTYTWAEQDAKDHFKNELSELFPEGYEFDFIVSVENLSPQTSYWKATNELRFKIEKLLYPLDSCEEVKILQQLWINENGKQEWRNVPEVE